MKIWITGGLLAFTLSLSVAQAGNVPAAKKALEIATVKFAAGSTNQAIRLEGSFSDSDLQPRQWDVTFYDAKRSNKGAVVRVKDGAAISIGSAVRIVDSARSDELLRNVTGYDPKEVINLKRWKFDSTEVLTKIGAQAGMDKVQITDVKMELQKLSDGDVAPVWSVRVKARLRSQPSHEGWIGSVVLSAETGEILKNDTNIDKLAKASWF